MAYIEKRERPGGTYWRARVRIKGFPAQQKTFSRKTDAKLWAQQTEAAIRKGEFKNVVKAAGRYTLSEVIERYRLDIAPHKAATTRRTENTYLSYWEGKLGAYKLSYIDADAIQDALDELALAGDTRRKDGDDTEAAPRPKSRKTIKLYRDALAMLFSHAIRWGYTSQTPLDGVSKITKIRNERTRYLTDEERASLLKACRNSPKRQLYPIVVFALATGARKNEILKLTLHDVDLERSLAILRDTKNGETRGVPIVHHLKDVLTDHIKEVKPLYASELDKAPQEWLFPRSDGQAPIDIRKAWENARDKAGLTDFRFHDLRHSTASYLAMDGASLVEIAEILGHRTLQMVKRYAHLSADHLRDRAQTLSEKRF